MIGILIVSHGAFGESLIHSASHVLGKRPLYLRQLGVTVHDDPDAILPVAEDLIAYGDFSEDSGAAATTTRLSVSARPIGIRKTIRRCPISSRTDGRPCPHVPLAINRTASAGPGTRRLPD